MTRNPHQTPHRIPVPCDLVCIGFVVKGQDGALIRGAENTSPRVYDTEGKAKKYSKGGEIVPVYCLERL